MTIVMYTDNIEELIDLKIEQKVYGLHHGATIKLYRSSSKVILNYINRKINEKLLVKREIFE